jgi:hypothetical protein
MLPALKSGDEGGLFGFEFRVGHELEEIASGDPHALGRPKTETIYRITGRWNVTETDASRTHKGETKPC